MPGNIRCRTPLGQSTDARCRTPVAGRLGIRCRTPVTSPRQPTPCAGLVRRLSLSLLAPLDRGARRGSVVPVDTPRPCVLVATALLLLLPACFTASLWGGRSFGAEIDPETGRSREVLAFDLFGDEREEPTAAEIGCRLLLTPLAVVLDALTCPVQVLYLVLVDPRLTVR